MTKSAIFTLNGLDELLGDAVHTDTLQATSFTGHYGDGTLGHSQRIRQHLDECLIGRALDRRRADPNEKRPVSHNGQPWPGCSWNHPHVEKHWHKSNHICSPIDAEPCQPQLTRGHLFVKTGAVL